MESKQKINKRDIVLAGMYPAGTDPFSPVQVQKLFFLLDNNISQFIDGPHFNFIPYDYGPFDKEVYRVLESLEQDSLVESVQATNFSSRLYRLTDDGVKLAWRKFNQLSVESQEYIRKLVSLVHSLTFSQLISLIYDLYPEMKENSVFRALS